MGIKTNLFFSGKFPAASILPVVIFLLLVQAADSSGQNKPAPKLEDFAGSLVLTGTEGSLLGLEIPEAVYQGITRQDLGDIRVFDSAGLLVPFVIRSVPGITLSPPPEEVPFFLWEQENDRSLPGNTDIVIDASGTVLNIKGRGPLPSAAPAYLLDLSGLSHTPRALNISLGKEGEWYNTGVRIYSSADLARWSLYEKKQTLAWFGGGGTTRDTLEMPRDKSRYLLLKFDKPDLPPRRITALFDDVEIPPATREKTISGEWQGEDKRIIDYFTGGFYPLRAIGFTLPQADSIEVRVKNKFAGEGEWQFVKRTNLFRINSGAPGEALTNGELEINSAAPFWELEAAGDLAFSSPPDAYIRWAVYELVFLSRGQGPWTLAWGSKDWGPAEGGLNLSEFAAGQSPGPPEIKDARALGEPRYQARPGAAKPPRDWGQFILWGILILAVLLLSGLAFYIAKSMNKGKV